MKLLRITSILTILSTALWGQTTIIGTIQNATSKTVTLFLYPTVLGESGEKLETVIGENDQFQFEIAPTIAVPALLNVLGAHYQLFLFPEKSLEIYIELDAQNRALLSFEGAAAKDNQFYLKYQNVLYEEKKKTPHKLFEKFKPKAYLAYQTNLKQRKTDYLHKNQPEIDKRLFIWLKNDITYQFANNLLEYPNRELITQTPSKKYYHFLKEIKYNNTAALLQPSYQHFILGYTHHQMFKPKKWGRYARVEQKLKFVRRFFLGDVLHYLQFFILKSSLEFEEASRVENAYRAFLGSNAPKGLKQKLRAVHKLGNQNVIGKFFPIYMLQNSHKAFWIEKLNNPNGKLFYVCTTPIESEKIEFIQKLAVAINEKKYLNFGLIGLNDAIKFPNGLIDIPHFWIATYAIKEYFEELPIKEDSYFIFVNKYGQVIEYITSELDQVLIKEIVNFMVENNNRRVYSTLSNSKY